MSETASPPQQAERVRPEDATRFAPRFDAAGLMACVAVSRDTGTVLMVAFVDAEALRRTLATGEAHFFSRSRNAVWRKGETSGAILPVARVLADCDQDALVYEIAGAPPEGTCHTGRTTCFWREVPMGPGALDRPFAEASV